MSIFYKYYSDRLIKLSEKNNYDKNNVNLLSSTYSMTFDIVIPHAAKEFFINDNRGQ